MKHVFTLVLSLIVSVGLFAQAQAQTTALPLRLSLSLPAQATKQASAREAAPVLNSTTATTIRYVKADASGNGSSWSNASGDLQAMINASASGDQVWIAGGTYKPSTTGLTNSRDAAFSLKNGVSVLGGFTGNPGTENTNNASTRTAIPSSTTLSGDIGTIGDNSDNSYHVVYNDNNGLDNSAILDGVTITGGNADGPTPGVTGFGGGLFNLSNSPTIINCLFSQNYATVGGGMVNAFTTDSKVINCSFLNNTGTFVGGLYEVQNSGSAIINCFFEQNSPAGFAAASTSTPPTLTNCTFRNNSPRAIRTLDSGLSLVSCLLWNNGGQNAIFGGAVAVSYSLIEAGETNYTNGGNNQTLTTSPFDNATGPALKACAPAVDAGNDAANTITTDVLGNARKLRTIDIGAAEFQGTPTQPVAIVSQSQSASAVCAGTAVDFFVTFSGTGPFTLAFFRDNTKINETSSTSPGRVGASLNVTQSGSYQYVITTACNSVTTTFSPVTVNPLPTAYSLTGGGAYCAGGVGSVVGLSGSQTGVNYQLLREGTATGTVLVGTGNPITFGPQSTTGTYTVQATNASTCTQTMSGSAVVSVNALPTVSITPLATAVCQGQSATFAATPGLASYRWSTPNNEPVLTTATISASVAGTYSLTVTNSNSCSATATASLTVTPLSPDYQPLVDLYNATNGANWIHKDNWLTGCTPCGWYGVSCDGNGRVTGLNLLDNNLVGTIPGSLSGLVGLTSLEIGNNIGLTGGIPTSIGSLTALQALNLSRTQLGGTIPASLGNLTQLYILYLNESALTGSIPEPLFALTRLQFFYLYGNQLSGSLSASLSALTMLRELRLYNNQLSGSIPANLSALTSLQELALNNNQLSGCLPASLSAFCGKNINLSNNPGLPGGGDFAAFCASGAGSDAFQPLATASPNPVCAGSPVSLSVTAGTFYQWKGPAGFTASAQTPGFTPASAASSGVYSVTVGNGSPTCTAITSVSLTVNPLPTPTIVGLPASICQEAAPVPLTGSPAESSPARGVFTIDGLTATTFNPAKLSVGQHTVVYSYTNASGCSATATQTVTIKATPAAPVITTQSGQSYPGGVSSLTISQNVGNVIFTASGCAGGTITWAGGNSTTLAASTFDAGVQTFTATCSQNGCTSPLATATLTVVGTTLSVLHRDGNGNASTNTLSPYVALQNDGKTAIPYAEITLRYWLTVENPAPLLFALNYAQVGSDKVRLRYVPTTTGNPGATGYIEFSFDASAGSLGAGGNSGPIQTIINKQDYSSFNQLNDYSYAAVGTFTPNERITAYRKGADGVPVLFYGLEPGPIVPTQSVKAMLQNNTGDGANSIEAVLSVTNDGNVPVNYGDLKVRYYFTADNGQPLVVNQVGYTALGSGNVTGQVVTISPALGGADRYLEVSFSAGLGQLAPGASTGGVTYQIRHADYSGFTQLNDYSYQGTGGMMQNRRVVVFVAGKRAYGVEPGAGGRLSVEETPLGVEVLGNPVVGSVVEVLVRGAEGELLTLSLTDVSGRSVTTRRVERAGAVERQRLEVGNSPAGLLLLRVSTPTQSQTVKVLKAD